MIDKKKHFKEAVIDTSIAAIFAFPVGLTVTWLLYRLGLNAVTTNVDLNATIFALSSTFSFTVWSLVRKYFTNIALAKREIKRASKQDISTLAKNPAGPSGDRIDLWWNKTL